MTSSSASADLGNGADIVRQRPPDLQSNEAGMENAIERPIAGEAEMAEAAQKQDAPAPVTAAVADLDAAASAASAAIANQNPSDQNKNNLDAPSLVGGEARTADPHSESTPQNPPRAPSTEQTTTSTANAPTEPQSTTEIESSAGTKVEPADAGSATSAPTASAMEAPAQTLDTNAAGIPNPSTPPQNRTRQNGGNGTMVTPVNPLSVNTAVDGALNMNNPQALLAAMERGQWHRFPDPQATPMGTTVNPATITPSHMHLSNLADINPEDNSLQVNNKESRVSRQRLESFARMEFADSTFQINTFNVVIGRDRAAIRQAQLDEKRAEEYERQCEENARLGLPPPMPYMPDRNRFSRSYVSEEGGMLGPESGEDEESGRPAAKRRKLSSDEDEDAEKIPSLERQYVTHSKGAASVDLDRLKPSPDYEAFVGIHSPGPDIAKKSRGISRRHLKIHYNHDTGQFQASPLHRNGFFIGDNHHGPGSTVVLKSGDKLQIKDVDFTFIINGVKLGSTGGKEDIQQPKKASGGKSMSFDFEANGTGVTQDTSDEELSEVNDVDMDDVDLSQLETQPKATVEVEEEDEGEEDDQPMEDAPELDKSDSAARVPVPFNQPGLDPSLMMATEPPKKRGPGRPPKNGFMSKREQRELKKREQELARERAAQEPLLEPPTKRKVGRPRKHPIPEGEGSAEKRKYKPRKLKGEGEEGEGSDPEKPIKEKKGKAQRPKSPPLDLRREDYTEEQLQKPTKNYGVLIDEALSAAPDGLTLKQIYKRITARYPWFYFHTETKGWESSVRHNLIGNSAFRKDEFSIWRREPGVELDAGKKRKATSPDRNLAAQQAYNAQHYQYGQPQHQAHMQPHGYVQGQQVPPNYHYNTQQLGQAQPPQQVQHQYGRTGPPQNVVAGATAGTPQQLAYTQHPQSVQAQQGVQVQYHSPYQQTPPAQGNAAIKTEATNAGIQRQAPQPQPHPATVGIQAPTGHPAQGMPQPQPPPPPQPQQQQQQQQPQPQSQQQQQPPVQPPAAAAPTPPAPPPSGSSHQMIDHVLATRLRDLRNSLASGLINAKTPHAETLVWSALDRLVGLKKTSSGYNDSLETTVFNGMETMIQRTLAMRYRTSTPDGPADGSKERMTLLTPEATKHIEALRDQCVGAIKPRLGEENAVILVHSAIMRALGLADKSRATNFNQSYINLEEAILKNVYGVLDRIGSEQRRSSTGTRPSPAASQSRPSATPQPPPARTSQTPVAHQAQPITAAQTTAPQAAAAPPVQPTVYQAQVAAPPTQTTAYQPPTATSTGQNQASAPGHAQAAVPHAPAQATTYQAQAAAPPTAQTQANAPGHAQAAAPLAPATTYQSQAAAPRASVGPGQAPSPAPAPQAVASAVHQMPVASPLARATPHAPAQIALPQAQASQMHTAPHAQTGRASTAGPSPAAQAPQLPVAQQPTSQAQHAQPAPTQPVQTSASQARAAQPAIPQTSAVQTSAAQAPAAQTPTPQTQASQVAPAAQTPASSAAGSALTHPITQPSTIQPLVPPKEADAAAPQARPAPSSQAAAPQLPATQAASATPPASTATLQQPAQQQPTQQSAQQPTQ